MYGDSLHPIFFTSLLYSMLHLVHAAVSRIGWCISEAHTGLQPGAPCSPALTLSLQQPLLPLRAAPGHAPLPGGLGGCFLLTPLKTSCPRLLGMGKGWRGGEEPGVPQPGQALPVLAQPLLLLGRAACPPRPPPLSPGPSPGTCPGDTRGRGAD